MKRIKEFSPWLIVFTIVILICYSALTDGNSFISQPREGDIYIMICSGVDSRRLPYKVHKLSDEEITFAKSRFEKFNPPSESAYSFTPDDFDTTKVFVMKKKQLKMIHYNALVGIRLNASLRE